MDPTSGAGQTASNFGDLSGHPRSSRALAAETQIGGWPWRKQALRIGKLQGNQHGELTAISDATSPAEVDGVELDLNRCARPCATKREHERRDRHGRVSFRIVEIRWRYE